jgi:hypothetical protein
MQRQEEKISENRIPNRGLVNINSQGVVQPDLKAAPTAPPQESFDLFNRRDKAAFFTLTFFGGIGGYMGGAALGTSIATGLSATAEGVILGCCIGSLLGAAAGAGCCCVGLCICNVLESKGCCTPRR